MRKFVKKPLPEATTCFWCDAVIDPRHQLVCPECASGVLLHAVEYE